jgi:hypothetical protein
MEPMQRFPAVVSLGCARPDSVLSRPQQPATLVPARDARGGFHHFIVGITYSDPPPTPVGQRDVTVLRRV